MTVNPKDIYKEVQARLAGGGDPEKLRYEYARRAEGAIARLQGCVNDHDAERMSADDFETVHFSEIARAAVTYDPNNPVARNCFKAAVKGYTATGQPAPSLIFQLEKSAILGAAPERPRDQFKIQ